MNNTYCLSIERRNSYNAKSSSSVNAAYEHNLRLYPEGKMPENIDENLTPLNKTLVALPDGETYMSLCKKAERSAKKVTGRKIRKDAVRALTFVCNYQSDCMDKEKIYQWAADSLEWIKKTFGEDNIKHAVLHMDEPGTNPHLHIMVIPVDSRGSLCCHNILREPYRIYQDNYFNEVANKYGLSRGKMFKRKSPNLDTISKYKQATIMRPLISDEELTPLPSELDENGHLLYEKDEEGREHCPYLERFKEDIQAYKWQISNKETQTQERYDDYFADAAHMKYEADKEVVATKEKYRKKEKELAKQYEQQKEDLKKEYLNKEADALVALTKAEQDLSLFRKYLAPNETFSHLAKRFKGFDYLTKALAKPENIKLRDEINKIIADERATHTKNEQLGE